MPLCSELWEDVVSKNETGQFAGPLGINYLYFHSCSLFEAPGLSFVLMLVLPLAVLRVLSTTADIYFSPVLARMCSVLGLSHSVAGVTLLAFGNGAPDLFSSLAAFTGEANSELGMGALLGGAMFISCVIFGTICLSSEDVIHMDGFQFRRNGLFLILVLLFLLVVGVLIVTVTFAVAVCFLVLYFIFVVLVVGQRVFALRKEGRIRPRNVSIGSSGTGSTEDVGALSAFWLDGTDPVYGNNSNGGNYTFVTLPPPNLNQPQRAYSVPTSCEDQYERASVNSSEERPSTATSMRGTMIELAAAQGQTDRARNTDSSNLSLDRGREGSIDLAVQSPLVVRDSYFETPLPSTSRGARSGIAEERAREEEEHQEGWFSPFTGRFSTDYPSGKSGMDSITTDDTTTQLRASLLDVDDREEAYYADQENQHRGNSTQRSGVLNEYRSIDSLVNQQRLAQESEDTADAGSDYPRGRDTSRPPDMIRAMYWYQQRFKRSAVRKLLLPNPKACMGGRCDGGGEAGIRGRISSVIQATLELFDWPFVVMRTLTIPDVDSESWSKPIAVIQPFFFGGFLMEVGYLSTDTALEPSLIATIIIASLLLSFLLYLKLYSSRPPTHRAVILSFLVVAFVVCIAWIFILASELVAMLSTLGVVMGIHPALLGMTVLSWGNAAGELAANVALCKAGYPQMALAACFGAPIFNLLMGLGLSLVVVTWKEYPTPFVLNFDHFAIIAAFFVLVGLCLSLWLGARTDYVIGRQHGYVVLSLYVVYLVVCGVVAVTV